MKARYKVMFRGKSDLAAIAAILAAASTAWAQVTPPSPTSPNYDNDGGVGDGTWMNSNNWDTVAIPTNTEDAKINDGLTAFYDADIDGGGISFGTLTIGVGSMLEYDSIGGPATDFLDGDDIYFLDNSELRIVSGAINSAIDFYVGSGVTATFGVVGRGDQNRPGGTVVGSGHFIVKMGGWVQQRWQAADFTGDMTFTAASGSQYLRELGGWSGSNQMFGQGINTIDDNIWIDYNRDECTPDNATLKLVGDSGSGNPKLRLEAWDETIANLVIDSPTGTADTLEVNAGGLLTVTNAVTLQGTPGTVYIDGNGSGTDAILVTPLLVFTGGAGWTLQGDGVMECPVVTNAADATINSPLSGDVSKVGSGTLSMGNAAGSWSVDQGTLSLTDAIAPGTTISVASGAILNLNYTGSRDVMVLNLGGSPAAAGEWGAVGSGADNESALITGTGVIVNGAGAIANYYYWDGGDADTPGTGDGVSDGGNGTWNTTLKNWDNGTVAYAAFANTTADKAIFGGTGGIVTNTDSVTLGNLVLTTTTGELAIRGSGTLNFPVGALIESQGYKALGTTPATTIGCGISGSPVVQIAKGDVNNIDAKRVRFEPSGSTVQTLGQIQFSIGGGSQHTTLDLAGDSTGNTIESIASPNFSYAEYIVKDGTGDWTINGNIDASAYWIKLMAEEGTLTINGHQAKPGLLYVEDGGRLAGNYSAGPANDTGELGFQIRTGGVLSPGDGGVGTMTFDWGKTTDLTVQFQDNAILEYDISATTNDLVVLSGDGNDATKTETLDLDNFVIKPLDAGGNPVPSDQFPVFKYDQWFTVDMTGFGNTAANFDLSDGFLGSPSLVDDGNGTIYLTGLTKSPGGTLILLK